MDELVLKGILIIIEPYYNVLLQMMALKCKEYSDMYLKIIILDYYLN